MQFEIGKTSRLGNREINQDRLTTINSESGVVLVLGDGLGGKPGGEVASQALVDTVTSELAMFPLPAEEPEKFLIELLRRAHRAVLIAGQEQSPPLSPGTTAVLCLVQNGMAWWAHVGDSRLYLFRDGLPMYRTQDHSYVEELYQGGLITLDKRDDHPMRNYVTQCIGLHSQEPEIAVSKAVPLQEGDVLLLCSDGFWEPLDDALIGTGVEQANLNRALDKLGDEAEQTSYPRSDNTSAVALRVVSLQQPGLKTSASKAEKKAANRKTLDGAIEEIEQAIRDYQDEMDNN